MSLLNLREILQDSWFDNFWHTKLYIFNLIIVNKVLTNLKTFLLFNNSREVLQSFSCYECNSVNCMTCRFLSKARYIILNSYFYLPILSNSNCNSTGCIYIIECQFCKSCYVGETGRSVKERIQEHIRLINHEFLFKNTNSEVAKHFNLPLHDFNFHFKFYIFKSKVLNFEERRNIENDMIHLILNVNKKIINRNIPNMYAIKRLTFA